MKSLKLCPLRLNLKFALNPTRTLLRTLLLLNLSHQIRTLGSGGSGDSEVSGTHHYQYHPRGHGRVPPMSQPLSSILVAPEGIESSLENSVKYSRNSNNAIVRGSANRNRVPEPSQDEDNSVQDGSMPEETLRKVRLEMIKKLILKKLRLTEPPKPPPSQRPHYRGHGSSPNKNLPLSVILDGTLRKHSTHPDPTPDRDVEDFYGKTEQIVVFPEETEADCATLSDQTHPSACFLFKLPQNQIRWEEIESVELWAYKLPDPGDEEAQSFYVNGLLPSGQKALALRSNVRLSRGWFSFNLTSTATTWLRHGEIQQTLQLGCSTCAKFADDEDTDELGSPVGTEGEERPLLVFNMAGAVVKKRSRRHINCSNRTRECCRERLTVNFKQIGMDWIIGPQSYEAFFCKGSCVGLNGLSSSASRRGSIISKVRHTYGNSNATTELIPCCTATRMSSISLVFNDWGVNSTTPTTRIETLPNMVVETCGCL